jgi:hypothetical protein
MQTLDHHGYRLHIDTFGSGWRVRIYAPGDNAPMLDAPTTDHEDGQTDVVHEAQEVVDRNIRATAELLSAAPLASRFGRRWLDWRLAALRLG